MTFRDFLQCVALVFLMMGMMWACDRLEDNQPVEAYQE